MWSALKSLVAISDSSDVLNTPIYWEMINAGDKIRIVRQLTF